MQSYAVIPIFLPSTSVNNYMLIPLIPCIFLCETLSKACTVHTLRALLQHFWCSIFPVAKCLETGSTVIRRMRWLLRGQLWTSRVSILNGMGTKNSGKECEKGSQFLWKAPTKWLTSRSVSATKNILSLYLPAWLICPTSFFLQWRIWEWKWSSFWKCTRGWSILMWKWLLTLLLIWRNCVVLWKPKRDEKNRAVQLSGMQYARHNQISYQHFVSQIHASMHICTYKWCDIVSLSYISACA